MSSANWNVSLICFVLFLGLMFCAGCSGGSESHPETSVTYEVLSIYQYPQADTNGYGGVYGYNVGYHVSYIDENGNVGELEMRNQSDWDNPNMLVTIGNETKLVVTSKGKKTLYLTKEDFEKMNVKVDIVE